MSKYIQTNCTFDFEREKLNVFFSALIFKEDYQDLPLVVQDSPNLLTSLANIFTIHEHLVGDNQYRCSTCKNQLCDAEKWAKISKLPPILTLPLQRFVYDIKTGNRLKKTTRYEFPFEIDLKEFCEVESLKKLNSFDFTFRFYLPQESVLDTNYELFAVVIHKGTCYSGHYYGYIKDVDQIGAWIRTQAPPVRRTILYDKKKLLRLIFSRNHRAKRNHQIQRMAIHHLERVELVLKVILSKVKKK